MVAFFMAYRTYNCSNRESSQLGADHNATVPIRQHTVYMAAAAMLMIIHVKPVPSNAVKLRKPNTHVRLECDSPHTHSHTHSHTQHRRQPLSWAALWRAHSTSVTLSLHMRRVRELHWSQRTMSSSTRAISRDTACPKKM